MDNKNQTLNLIIAVILTCAVIAGWQYFYEKPRLEAYQAQRAAYEKQLEAQKSKASLGGNSAVQANSWQERENIVASTSRVKITSPKVQGSINPVGLKFDDLTLLSYKKAPKSDEPVELLSPSDTKGAYYVQFGWWADNIDQLGMHLPNDNTVWHTNDKELTPGKNVTFTWISPEDVKFIAEVALDENYLLTIKQKVENRSKQVLPIRSFGLINRNYIDQEKALNVVHTGPIATIDGTLKEITYDKLKEDKQSHKLASQVGWMGFSDKYWLTSLIPDNNSKYSSSFKYDKINNVEKYQAEFLSNVENLAQGDSAEFVHRLFAGAKEVKLLDKYEAEYDIPLFDRAIDFGWFYIITKPMFNALNFFYKLIGNFGVSILVVTIIVKLTLFSMTNKSMKSMKKMKDLQPKIERLKELYGDDKTKFNQEMMELYKKEKVNPISGCLPILVQIPILFSLYKVLYVTIEARHAPFIGWIQDLSSADPTNIFNLFGLLPFTPPSMLHVGAWPILMAVTMFLQQRMSPQPTDPVQANMMKLMPVMFLVMFASLPSGVIIYWTWSNLLSIVQQYFVNRNNAITVKA